MQTFSSVTSSRFLLTAESPDLRAIPAILHITPAAASIAAGVQKHPTALVTAALAEAREIRRRQQIRGRLRDSPENGIERVFRLIPRPGESGGRTNQAFVRFCDRYFVPKQIDVRFLGRPLFQRAFEDPVQGFAELDCPRTSCGPRGAAGASLRFPAGAPRAPLARPARRLHASRSSKVFNLSRNTESVLTRAPTVLTKSRHRRPPMNFMSGM